MRMTITPSKKDIKVNINLFYISSEEMKEIKRLVETLSIHNACITIRTWKIIIAASLINWLKKNNWKGRIKVLDHTDRLYMQCWI